MKYRDYLIKCANEESKSMWSAAKDYGQKGLDFAQTPEGITTGTGAAIGAFLGWRNAVKNKRTGFRKALRVLLGAGVGGALAYGVYKAHDHLSGKSARREADAADKAADKAATAAGIQHQRNLNAQSLIAINQFQGMHELHVREERQVALAEAEADLAAAQRRYDEKLRELDQRKAELEAITTLRDAEAAQGKADAAAEQLKAEEYQRKAEAAQLKANEALQRHHEAIQRLYEVGLNPDFTSFEVPVSTNTTTTP